MVGALRQGHERERDENIRLRKALEEFDRSTTEMQADSKRCVEMATRIMKRANHQKSRLPRAASKANANAAVAAVKAAGAGDADSAAVPASQQSVAPPQAAGA